MSSVRLFDGDVCVGVVKYTSNLDHWDGGNWTSGSMGRHIGCGKTRSGRYYICYGTEWQGGRNRAEYVTERAAKATVLEHDPDEYEGIFGEPVPDLSAE